jgi:glycosyltransferase involved in cell wall biosynthesis
MSRKSLLAVFPVTPWPARQNGVALRYYPVLDAFRDRYDIHVIVLCESELAPSDDPLLAGLRSVAQYDLHLRRSTLTNKIRTVARVLSPWHAPYIESSHHSDRAFEIVDSAIARHNPDTLLWVGCYCRDALHRISRRRRGSLRIVNDNVDSTLLHYQRLFRKPGLFRRLDIAKTRYREKRLATEVDELIYIAPADARAAGECGASVIPNGILTSDFVAVPPLEFTLGYLGAMDYPPNIEAAIRLHDEIFQPLKARFPKLRLHIIGRSPVEAIRRLAGKDVVVTGAVDNIWTEIGKVSVFVFPMASGAGLQNKILEAMYASRPVVTTQICNDSLEAREGKQILCGQSSADLIAATERLLLDGDLRRSLGASGRSFVEHKYAMHAVIESFEHALFPASR